MNLPKEFFKIWNWTQLIILSHKYIFHNSRKEKWVSSMQFKGPPNHSFAHWTISILLVWSPKKKTFLRALLIWLKLLQMCCWTMFSAAGITNHFVNASFAPQTMYKFYWYHGVLRWIVEIYVLSWFWSENIFGSCKYYYRVKLSLKKISEPLLLSCATNKK